VAEPTWNDDAKVAEYTERVGRLAARRAGEVEVLDALPPVVHRALDLGCGDGRLLGLVLDAHPEVVEAVAVDRSPPMLDLARERFAGDDRVRVLDADLGDAVDGFGTFDAIVTGFALHHLPDQRKRSIAVEIAASLAPGGVFANLEVVACATPLLQAEFEERIGRPGGDPEDLLAPVEDQLAWLRDAGLAHVDCQWRWRGFAVLTARRPA
jgi:SAM-dependent methyltransferase